MKPDVNSLLDALTDWVAARESRKSLATILLVEEALLCELEVFTTDLENIFRQHLDEFEEGSE